MGPEGYPEDLEASGYLFESMAVRNLRIYAQVHEASVHDYRDYGGLKVDAVIATRDGRWMAAEVKLGVAEAIDQVAALLTQRAGRRAPGRPHGPNWW